LDDLLGLPGRVARRRVDEHGVRVVRDREAMVFELLGKLARLGAEVETEPRKEVRRVPLLFELDPQPPVVLGHGGTIDWCEPRAGGDTGLVSKRSDAVTEQLARIRRDLRGLWTALTTDPKEQARKERTWALLSGALAGASKAASSKAATKIWGRATG